ncbi:hypothetical protein SDC9_111722 [bioreactor metagenome]|uniref:Restriction endonuclease type I HsdR second RecA-like helicase domain-containing protein n=1 Tax=bioreactor metagenome TaxID=1076179 RepID=A0A645BJW6_9ZZZZ
MQTGFDEPKLHTLFLDKEIRDINAIQTISRVNRTVKYKEDCHIIDLSHNNVNILNIREAFKIYCDMVISDMEPMTIKVIIERIYKTLTFEVLFKKWFDTYQGSLLNSTGNTNLVMSMEEDFRRWITDALKRKQAESEKELESTSKNEIADTDDDALKLKKLINEYFHTITLINGIIEIDAKYQDLDFIDFWKRFIYVYDNLYGKNRNNTITINVIYDDDLGLVVASETSETEGGGSNQKGKKKQQSGSDPLAIINKLNESEKQKGEKIEEWRKYIYDLFDFLKTDEKLIAKINTPDHFTREELYKEFKKTLRKFLRKANDPIKRKFFEENFELLMEDFENSLTKTFEISIYKPTETLPIAAEP